MKKLIVVAAQLAVAILILATGVSAQKADEALSPAQQKIAWLQKAIEKNPQQVQNYNHLAIALARRARETSDTSYYAQAEEALKKSFALSPDNLEGRKARVWILLGKHEFAAARTEALAVNKLNPDDVLVYGFLVDANAELGNYKEAEEAAQWMLDIRPGNVPGLTRAAYLRELFGDTDGAFELMKMAYEQLPSAETEDRAWTLTQMAHLQLSTGKVTVADKLLHQALTLFPDYHYALANLARVRTAQKRYAEAVRLMQQRYQSAPHAENLYDVAEALERAGRKKEAAAAFAAFEKKALAESAALDNANRELIFFYADHAKKPGEALRLARREAQLRRDTHTLDAYAWALYVSGQYAEARKQMDAALAVGIRDAKMLYHAGAIETKLTSASRAARYFKQSLETNPRSEVAGAARIELGRLSGSTTFVARKN